METAGRPDLVKKKKKNIPIKSSLPLSHSLSLTHTHLSRHKQTRARTLTAK